jgi:acyl-ACP thioesterase
LCAVLGNHEGYTQVVNTPVHARVVGLDMNGHNNNLSILDIETLELEILKLNTF